MLPQTLLGQAIQAHAAGQFGTARGLCQKLLERDRRHVEAIKLLGVIAHDMGLYDEALRHLRQGVRLAPADASFHHRIGRVHADQGRAGDAVSAFDRALELKPGDLRIIESKAILLERVGESAAARGLLEPLVQAGTESAPAAAAFARVALREQRSDEAVRYLETKLAGAALPPARRQLLLFTLAKACDKAGAYDRAFAACREANEIERVPFEPAAYRAKVDELIQAFAAPEGLAAASNRSETPVFVAGMPRSGTTLVEQVLDAHPEAHGAGELIEVTRIVDGLSETLKSYFTYPQCVRDLTPKSADRLAAGYLRHLRSLSRVKRVINKSLDNFEHLGLISRLWPAGRVVVCRRDPVDTCLSCYLSPILPHRAPYVTDLGHLGFVYRQHERLLEHGREVLELPIFEVVYEALVGDQERVSRALVEFTGLDWDDACLRFHQAPRTVMTLSYDQVTQPIYASSMQRWRNYEKHLGPLLESLSS